MVVPPNGWFTMENANRTWMIWGYPYFRKTAYTDIYNHLPNPCFHVNKIVHVKGVRAHMGPQTARFRTGIFATYHKAWDSAADGW